MDICTLPLLALLTVGAGVSTFKGLGLDPEVTHHLRATQNGVDLTLSCLNSNDTCYTYWPLYVKEGDAVLPYNLTDFSCEQTAEFKDELQKELEFAFWFSVPVTVVAVVVIFLFLYLLLVHAGGHGHTTRDPSLDTLTTQPLLSVN